MVLRARAPSPRCRCRARRARSSRRAARRRAPRPPCRSRSTTTGSPAGMPVAAAASAVIAPDHLAGQLELEQLLPPHAEPLEQRGVVAPVPAVDVDRPLQEDVVRGRVAALAGEAVAEVAGRRRRVGEGRVVGQVGLIGAVVHPADHRLDERSVGVEERLAAADRAEADGGDLARIAVELRHRLAARSGERVPEVVAGWKATPCAGRLIGRSGLAALGDDAPLGVDDDDLRALRAAVDADQVRAWHACSGSRPSGRGSRRPPTRMCPLT